ncbi:uncharacterized protein LOC133295480 [Gastrolobium bilobum]|uniref:uncharacterized protein LOC133295480 n=1 Tax=Gastrolobium bilobum TaxID=150636 RepID=UPI002AB03D96|nr:uncharacterized protein LOC133295480 [Gastrolobium bilobum]
MQPPPHSEQSRDITTVAMNAILQRMQEMENRFLAQQGLNAQRMEALEAELRNQNLVGRAGGAGRGGREGRGGCAGQANEPQHQNAATTKGNMQNPHHDNHQEGGGPVNNKGDNYLLDEEANNSPFTERLMNLAIPPRFKSAKIPPYDRSQDPEAHLEAFKTEMLFNGITGPIKARIFAATLTGQAMAWITRLPRHSIDSFEDLARTFRLNFATSKAHPMSAYALGRIRQKENESLRKYLDRFKDAALKVQNLTEPVHLHLIISGLDGDSPLAKSIYKNPVNDLEEFRRRSDKYIDVEDMQKAYGESRGRSPNHGSPSKKNNKDRDQRGSKKSKDTRDKRSEDLSPRRKYDDYTPLNMSRSRIWKENGHITDDCWDLRDAIEKHIRKGELKQYIIQTQGKKNNKRRQRNRSQSRSLKREDRKDQKQDRPAKGKEVEDKDESFQEAEFECNVISRALGGGGDTANARRKYLKEVMSVRDRPTFKGKASNPAPPRLFFTQEELAMVVPGHTDGLVITGVLVNYRVKRIFIDHGSLTDIILWDAFQRMNLDENDLKPCVTELVGFNGAASPPKGYIDLKMTLGTKDAL